MLRESKKKQDEPECAACAGASGRPLWGVVWGYPLCEACGAAWKRSPELAAAELQLYPMPLWQLAREKRPYVPPSDEESKAAYTLATRAFVEGRKRAAA